MDSTAAIERYVLTLRGQEWLSLPTLAREHAVDLCFHYWRSRGFPYYCLSDADLARQFQSLTAAGCGEILIGDEIQLSMIALRAASYFHPQMWAVPIRDVRSPLERFENDEHLKRLIRKALHVFPERRSVNECNLRRMLITYSRTARVSNFRPTAAKALYEKYSGLGDRVLDFSAGYGGRLLGCLPLNREYIGIDPCTDQVRGLTEMLMRVSRVAPVRAVAEIYQACAEDFLPSLAERSFALVFSSPPYFDYERYSVEPSQSYLRYPQYEDWAVGFLRPLISESARVLDGGGRLLINVADVKGLPLIRDVLALASRFLIFEGALRLRLGRMPYLRSQPASGAFKHEPIFVFRKPLYG